MELLYLIPQAESFEEAKLLMEGLTTLGTNFCWRFADILIFSQETRPDVAKRIDSLLPPKSLKR